MGRPRSSAAPRAPCVVGAAFLALTVVTFLLQLHLLDPACHAALEAATAGAVPGRRAMLHHPDALKRSFQSLRRGGGPDDPRFLTEAAGVPPGEPATDDGTGEDDEAAEGSASAGLPPPASALTPAAPPTTPRVRVLVGIFTGDFAAEHRCRHRQRRLLRLHPHTCPLSAFLGADPPPQDCLLVYTFVVGGNPDAPPLLVDESRPMVLPHEGPEARTYQGPDMLEPDVTLLNIRENMNEGKSQTWFAYGARLAREHGFDYIVKQDTDTVLFLDKYFAFVDEQLPPAPYNRNILAGSIADKLWWGRDVVNRQAPAERWAIRKYGGLLHLYAEGQWYLMSPDLAETVQQEAMDAEATAAYFGGHEDHDVSAMAFHSDRPIHLVIISMQQRHWVHRVKLDLGARWSRIWERETDRLRRVVEHALESGSGTAATS